MENPVLYTYKQFFTTKKNYEQKAKFLKGCQEQATFRLGIYPNMAREVLDWTKEEFFKLAKEY